jgi:hypothetical protein
MNRTGELRRWKPYLEGLLRQHGSLRGLREKMQAAGLVE